MREALQHTEQGKKSSLNQKDSTHHCRSPENKDGKCMAALPWKLAANSLAYKKIQDLCLRLGLTEQEHADPASLAWSNTDPELDNLFT